MGLVLLLVVSLAAVQSEDTLSTLMALVTAVLVYVIQVRWGAWRWLAALASAPAASTALPSRGGAGAVAVTLVTSVAIVVACWRARPPRIDLGVSLVGLLVVILGGIAAGPSSTFHAVVRDGGSPLVMATLPALAASIGLGRAAGSGLRGPTFLLLLLPAVGVVVLAEASSAQVGTPAVAWWPGAAVLGVTAILRGGRGRSADRPQFDEIDEAAARDFRARHGGAALAPVAIVIAAYNEVEGLPKVLVTLPDAVCGLPADVLVVDDGSSDGTADALVDTSAIVVRCPVNRGQGAALRLGYRIAREHGARFLLTTDADGQYDARDLPTVLSPILAERADFVSGSRILGRQHTHDRVRRAGVHVFAWLASALLGRRLTDTSFGLRAMRAEVPATVTLNQPQYQSSELLLGAISHGFVVLEVPGTMHVRSAGSTKKGRNVAYGRRYAGVVLGTWWREGCPRPAREDAAALRSVGNRVHA